MDGTNTQVNLKVEDPVNFIPPKIEISGIDSKRVPPRPHKLKPRDMNVLTPSGFWSLTCCVVPTPYYVLSSFFFPSLCLFSFLPSSVPSVSFKIHWGWEDWGPSVLLAHQPWRHYCTVIHPAGCSHESLVFSSSTSSPCCQFQISGPNKMPNAVTSFFIPIDITALYGYYYSAT